MLVFFASVSSTLAADFHLEIQLYDKEKEEALKVASRPPFSLLRLEALLLSRAASL